jgi:hypothetical protein
MMNDKVVIESEGCGLFAGIERMQWSLVVNQNGLI